MSLNRQKKFLFSRMNFSISFVPLFVGGFLDGINTCSLSTIVVFISFLLLFAFHRELLRIAGISFISAVFLMIFFLTAGYFSAFRASDLFDRLSLGIYFVLTVLFLLAGIVSFRQWWLINKGSSKTTPEIKGSKLGRFQLIFCAFAVGGAISFFSTFCPGDPQPFALILMLQSSGQFVAALGSLLVYSLAYVLPLLISFFLLLRFLGPEENMFARRHSALFKIIFAAIFLGTACGLIFTFL